MFSAVTGYNWQVIMFECAKNVKEFVFTEGGIASSDFTCTPDQTAEELKENGPQGCGTFLSYPFFISYILLVKLMITN